jgi:hypothetical protein
LYPSQLQITNPRSSNPRYWTKISNPRNKIDFQSKRNPKEFRTKWVIKLREQSISNHTLTKSISFELHRPAIDFILTSLNPTVNPEITLTLTHISTIYAAIYLSEVVLVRRRSWPLTALVAVLITTRCCCAITTPSSLRYHFTDFLIEKLDFRENSLS